MLNPGDIAGTTGASKRCLDNLIANKVAAGLVLDPTAGVSTKAQLELAATAYCIAKAVFDELVANGVVTVTIAADSTGDGLQTSATAGDPTTHPATPATLTGTVT